MFVHYCMALKHCEDIYEEILQIYKEKVQQTIILSRATKHEILLQFRLQIGLFFYQNKHVVELTFM